jgi:hypothetical protein
MSIKNIHNGTIILGSDNTFQQDIIPVTFSGPILVNVQLIVLVNIGPLNVTGIISCLNVLSLPNIIVPLWMFLILIAYISKR